jgi:hypothetical protein
MAMTKVVTDIATGKTTTIEMSVEEEAAFVAEQQAAANAVPSVVTPYQMRRALRQIGLRDQVESFVNSQDEATQDAWHYALEVRRDNAILLAGATALGKTSADIDNLFRLAATVGV